MNKTSYMKYKAGIQWQGITKGVCNASILKKGYKKKKFRRNGRGN